MERIPFILFPLPLARRIAQPFFGLGDRIAKFFPDFAIRLNQAEIDIRPREYMAIAIFSSWVWTSMIFFILTVISFFITLPGDFIFITSSVSLAIGFLSFLYILLYPRLIIARKVTDLDKNLLFALRHLLIQVKSGVPLYDGLVSVSSGNYGLVSEEIGECTKKISTGTEQTTALEELALKNPSLYFRRIVWQLTNAIRCGADLGDTLEHLVESLANEQKVAIRRYGSQLNPMAMMYMMLGVILPSLGITFLVVISSFSGIVVTEYMFVGLLAALIIFQFSFVGIVKSRRPAIEL
ncbi:MAG: type II secretion system F family protein [Candidatus Aenigmarchaeota archaeon]|nr:type II secretion system F family protein [Candidatus Aenigmarchaeota archaeon]